MPISRILLLVSAAAALLGQGGSFPLSSVTVKGTSLSSETVQQIAGLHLGASLNQADMESACKRLAQSGLFASVGYQYAPGPKQSYALTLNLTDQTAIAPAVIDIPGTNEEELWTWLASKYPNLTHTVPDDDSGQQFLAKEIETHIGSASAGQHIVARFEVDLKTERRIVVFQPETLPRIVSLSFTGTSEFRSDELAAMIRKVMGTEGFSQRRFSLYLDGVVRQAYEERGMYRVSFGKVEFTRADSQKDGGFGVAVTTHVSEGPKFTLGNVQFIGDDLPTEAMLKAADFHSGKVANWREIQQSIYALERPVKRKGYYDATARPERQLHDEQRQLDLRIAFALGPLYHFGQLSFTGLPPDLEARARKIWKMPSGAVYDYGYATEFVRDFAKTTDLSKYHLKLGSRKMPGQAVIDQVIEFEPATAH